MGGGFFIDLPTWSRDLCKQMPVKLDAFVLMSVTELNDLRTRTIAEMKHQMKAGQSFGRQGSHNKTGVSFSEVTQTIQAIDYALARKNGTIATETIADLSGEAV